MRTTVTFLLAWASLGVTAQVITADEAVRIAVEQNYGIKLARLDTRRAELLNTAGNAGMLPNVDAVGQYAVDNSSTKQTFFSGEVRERDNADQRVLDAAVQLNWTVFDGLAMFAAKDRLEALELIGQTQLRQQIEATTYDVLSTYYRLVQLRKAIDVQREGVRISRARVSIAEAGKRIVTASGLAGVQAQLDLSTDSAAVLDLAFVVVDLVGGLFHQVACSWGYEVMMRIDVPFAAAILNLRFARSSTPLLGLASARMYLPSSMNEKSSTATATS